MKLINILFLCLCLGLMACSKKNKAQSEEDLTESVVMSDEVDEDLDELDGIEVLDEEEPTEIVEEAEEFVAEELPEEVAVEEVPQEEPMQESESVEIAMTGAMGEYTVEKNDTLMWIAFKVYGDYSMWKKIKMANGLTSNRVAAGTVLKYEMPSEKFEWNPQGSPYLILTGDTLGGISGKVYGTQSKWKSIWNNNKPMIKNPNLIFAGFTLYYLPAENLALNK